MLCHLFSTFTLNYFGIHIPVLLGSQSFIPFSQNSISMERGQGLMCSVSQLVFQNAIVVFHAVGEEPCWNPAKGIKPILRSFHIIHDSHTSLHIEICMKTDCPPHRKSCMSDTLSFCACQC